MPGPDGELPTFLGPVLTPAPRAEAAGKRRDAVPAVAGTDGSFGTKRDRDRDPVFDRAARRRRGDVDEASGT